MKSSTSFFLAAGIVLWGMSSCSSTTTETTDTAVTTETVTPDVAATDNSATQATMSTDTLSDPGAAAGTLSDDPTNFILLAGSLDLLETQSSNQALAKASNPEVRNYAEQVLSEHRKISQQLRDLANIKKLKYPTVLLPKHQLMMNRLSEEKPQEFDKTYMELQEALHKELEELFEDGSKRHSDPEMKAFVNQNLPTMRAYLETSTKVKNVVD